MDLLVGLILSLVAAVVPAIIYVSIIWWCDRYEREPWPLIAAAFLWGAIPAIFISLVGEIILDVPIALISSGLAGTLLSAGVVAPIVEEIAKGMALLGIYVLARREFDGVLDGIIYGAVVGYGFAMTENVFYFVAAYYEGGLADFSILVVLRGVVFGLNHAFYTSLIGVGFGLARMGHSDLRRYGAPLLGLAAAILFHSLHNIFVSLAEINVITVFFSLATNWGGVFVVFIIMLLAWRQERYIIRDYLADEVGTTLTADEYRVAMSYRERLRLALGVAQAHGWRHGAALKGLHHLFTKLAFKKHRLKHLGVQRERQIEREIEQMRAEIQRARARLPQAFQLAAASGDGS